MFTFSIVRNFLAALITSYFGTTALLALVAYLTGCAPQDNAGGASLANGLDVSKSVLAVDRTEVDADGRDVTTVRVLLKDRLFEPVTGQMVEFATDLNGTLITQPTIPSDQSGQILGTIASSTPGPVVISAIVDPEGSAVTLTATETVMFRNVGNVPALDDARSSVVAIPTVVATGGQSLVTVTLRDQTNGPLVGYSVALVSDPVGASVSPTQQNTDDDGEAVFTVSHTNAGMFRMIAIVDPDTLNFSLSDQPSVDFQDPPPTMIDPDQSSLEISPDTAQPADGVSSFTVTAIARDAAGIPLPGHLLQFSTDPSDSSLHGVNGTSDSNGAVAHSFASSIVGTYTISVTADPDGSPVVFTQTLNAEFFDPVGPDPDPPADPRPDLVDIRESTLDLDPDSAPADGVSEVVVIVTARDENGDPIPNQPVEVFVPANSVDTVTIVQPYPTDDNGQTTATITSNVPHVLLPVHAEISGLQIIEWKFSSFD